MLTKASVPDYKQLASFGMPSAQLKNSTFKMPEPKVEGRAVRMKFEGAAESVRVEGVDALGGISNYFIGSDPKRWRTGIPNFAKVKYTSLYPGIDLVFYGNEQTLEYDFVVAPGAEPKVIKLSFNGADKVELTEKGDLIVHSGGEKLTLHAPVAYQEIDGKRATVKSAFKRVAASEVAFEVANYDRSRELVIDPTLVWATYVAGNFLDIPNAIAVGPFDNPYITGFTCSGNFPQTVGAGARLGCDVFVTKLDSVNTNRMYSAVIGGSAFDQAFGIAVDGEGAAYVAGRSFSNDFPGAGPRQGVFDAFVAKLDSNGLLVWSKLLGGSQPIANILGLGWTQALGIAIPQGCPSNCEPYIAGQTTVTDLQPVNAFQAEAATLLSAYLTKLSADGTQITYQTYFNGAGPSWRREPANDVIDFHRGKPENGDGDASWANGIAVDGQGKAYLTGGANIATLDTTLGDPYKGTTDGWVAKFDPGASGAASRLWATYIGGSGYDLAHSIALVPGCVSDCDSYITGETWSHDFPTTAGAYQTTFGGFQDQFVTKVNPLGAITYSTYVGRATGDFARAISVDTSGAAYITGTSTFVRTGISYPQIQPLQEGGQAPNGILLKSTDGGMNFSPAGGVKFAPGPDNVSAILLNNLVIDPVNPNIIYAATLRSGLLKSSDGAVTFAPTGITAGEIPRIVVDPNDPQIVYAGVGAGVRKSTDGAATFGVATLGEPVCALALDPRTNPSTLYAGTCRVGAGGVGGTGRVFKSTDGGANFTALPGLPDLASVFAVAVDPNDDAIYAGTSSGLFIDAPRLGAFTPTAAMSVGRAFFDAAVLPDGRVLVAGGTDLERGTVFSSADVYDASGGTSTPVNDMTTGRWFHTMTALTDGRVLVAGGVGPGANTTAELFDPSTGSFQATTGSMLNGRVAHTATLLGDGKVLVTGNVEQAALFDPVTGTFSLTAGAASVARSLHTATLLQDGSGRVLITGGQASFGGETYKSAELYDPATGLFAPTAGEMNTPRASHTAILLGDGRVLIAGGGEWCCRPSQAPAEIFDPTTGTFTPTGNMRVPRLGHTARLLATGEVLVIGGHDGRTLPWLAEVYDPSTEKFSAAAIAVDHFLAASARLTDGRVLVAGGHRGSFPTRATAEIFDRTAVAPEGFQRTGVHFGPIFDVKVDSTTFPATVYGATFAGAFRSSQRFPFTEWINFLGSPHFSLALDASTTPATLYAGNQNGELLKSTTRGNTFTIQRLAGFRTTNLVALAAPASAPGTVYAGLHEEHDAVVSKLSADGSQLLFSSWLGGSRGDFGQAIALGSAGHPYVTGGTSSADFGSAACGVGVDCVSFELLGQDNAFVAKLPNTLGSGTTQIGSNTTVTFTTVTTGGETTLTTSTLGPALPGNLAFAEPGNPYFDIATTATVSGTITVCVDYVPAQFADPNQLTLLHFQNNAWVNVTVSNDTTNGLICGQVARLSPFVLVIGKPQPVGIMIKPPATPPVPINIGSSGVIPVAILSSATFDATTVNASSINLNGANVRLKGKGSYQCSSSDVNGDSRNDFLCQVPTDQFQLILGTDTAVLTAVTSSNTPIQGQQQVNVVP